MQCIAAFDLGTTSIKGVLLTKEGQIIAEHTMDLHTHFGENGEVEQNPEDWWKVIRTISHEWFHQQQIAPEQIVAIAFSGQMEDLLFIDEEKETTKAILYSDTRAEAEAESLHHQFPELSEVTGNAISGSTPFAKLLWLDQHEKGFKEQRHTPVFSAKDYIIYKLTGAIVSDHVTCATTGLMDLRKRQWDTSLLEQAGLDYIQLPKLLSPGELAGTVTEEAAKLTGFLEGTPVMCGSGDAGASTMGAGAIQEGDCYLYLGTTGWVAVPSRDHKMKDSGIFTLAHVVPNMNIAIAPLLNVGNVHRWAMRSFLAQDDYSLFDAIALQSEPGANGLFCLPYLHGERSPVSDHDAKGAFWGIGPTTKTADFLRSVLEGISFSLRQITEMLVSEEVGNMTLIGGGAKSKAWCQILADITGRQVRVPHHSEYLPSLGAASSAFVYLGWARNESDFVDRFIMSEKADLYQPNKEHSEMYKEAYDRFLKMYPSMKNIYSL